MSVELRLHQIREIVRTGLTGNRLKSFSPLSAARGGTYLLNLQHRPFKAILKVIDQDGKKELEVEQEIHQRLKGIDGVQVPEIVVVDESRNVVPCTYYIRAYLSGLPWGDIIPLLSVEEGVRLAERCGFMLGLFHGVVNETYGDIGECGERVPWSELILEKSMADLRKICGQGWLSASQEKSVGDYLRETAKLLDSESRPRLTHRRLTPEDLLVKNEEDCWIAVGILRSGRSAWWDPLWDIASLRRQISNDHPKIVEALERSHGDVIGRSGSYEERLRVHMVLEAIHRTAETGERVGDTVTWVQWLKDLVGL